MTLNVPNVDFRVTVLFKSEYLKMLHFTLSNRR